MQSLGIIMSYYFDCPKKCFQYVKGTLQNKMLLYEVDDQIIESVLTHQFLTYSINVNLLPSEKLLIQLNKELR